MQACKVRNVVVGGGSSAWRTLADISVVSDQMHRVIGHKDLAQFEFTSLDRVWIFSYSRKNVENEAIFEQLRIAGVNEVIYISSSSAIVSQRTDCYEYPRVKQAAEISVLTMPQARVLTIGLLYSDPKELPAGDNIATSYQELANFMLAPIWSESEPRRKRLFRKVSIPFSNRAESIIYRLYIRLMKYAGARPCLLRPIDLILRILHLRWYGYVTLSNRLWISTMSL